MTADNTFTYSFDAGVNSDFDTTPMTESGNYRVTVGYTVPGEGFEREEVEFVFAYQNVEDGGQQDSKIQRQACLLLLPKAQIQSEEQ